MANSQTYPRPLTQNDNRFLACCGWSTVLTFAGWSAFVIYKLIDAYNALKSTESGTGQSCYESEQVSFFRGCGDAVQLSCKPKCDSYDSWFKWFIFGVFAPGFLVLTCCMAYTCSKFSCHRPPSNDNQNNNAADPSNLENDNQNLLPPNSELSL